MPTRLVVLASLLAPLLLAPVAQAQWLVTGTPVATAVDYQMNPAIVPDGNGGAIMVWEDGRSGGGYFDIYAQHVDASGVPTWAYGGLPVCTVSNQQLSPVLVGDGAGGAMMFWEDYRSSNNDIYGQEVSSGGVAQWTAGGMAISTATADQSDVRAIGDGNSGIFVGNPPGAILVWVDGRNSSDTGYDIYVQHVRRDGSILWAANGIPLCNASGGQFSPAIASDGTGTITGPKGAIVAWEDYRLNAMGPAHIYAGRISSGGVASWSTSGVAVCTAAGGQFSPQIAFVGGGQVIICWTDSRGTDSDIYAQKLDINGNSLWTADGVPADIAPATQSVPRIVSDGAGGAIIVWNDYRDAKWDLYAQRLDASGTRLWGDGGKPVRVASASANLDEVIPDGAGGAIVLWEDNRFAGYTYDYVQRLDASGNPLWPVNGLRVADYASNEVSPRLTNAPNGGAIVVWQDWRGTFYDIYANQVFPTGNVDVPSQAPAAFRVALAGSNPVRGDARFAVDLPQEASVTAEMFDLAGRRVQTLEQGTPWTAGTHALSWDGADAAGAHVGPGIFFLRVSAGSRSAVVKVVSLR